MPLNKSTGNMYDFITHTWNTIKGECPHGCTYCYMKRWGKQNETHLDEKEFKTDLGTGNFIFVGSSCDMFADSIPENWIQKTLLHCEKFDNEYLFQSKNPQRFYSCGKSLILPDKSVFCTTIETNRDYPEIMQSSPTIEDRIHNSIEISTVIPVYITIEPIMDFDISDLINLIKQVKPVQINIGADSGNNHLPEPPKEKIFDLIYELNTFTKVKIKKNLFRLIGDHKCK